MYKYDEIKFLDSLVVAVDSDFRNHICCSSLYLSISSMSCLKCGEQNCTACLRCMRSRNLYNGRISSLFLHLKLQAMNPSTLLAALQFFSVCFWHIPIKNYSGISVEYRQIKAAMGAPKQQMLPSFWSDNSTEITGDFKLLIVCDFPAGLASEFSGESPKKIKVVV